MIVECAICSLPFEAKRRTAKYCSGKCRQRAHDATPMPSGLVHSVTDELERAGVAESYPAQLAIELARQMTQPAATGIASLSKELRTVMDAALAGQTPPPADGDPDSEGDELDRLRRQRERKASEAGTGSA